MVGLDTGKFQWQLGHVVKCQSQKPIMTKRSNTIFFVWNTVTFEKKKKRKEKSMFAEEAIFSWIIAFNL